MLLLLHGGQIGFVYPTIFFLGFGALLLWVLMKNPPAKLGGLLYGVIVVMVVAFGLLGLWSLLMLFE
jgi:hypothetical protein